MTQVITKEYVQDVITKVKKALPGVFFTVAGGCPRDLHYGVPVKDVDVFLNLSRGYPIKIALGSSFGKIVPTNKEDEEYEAQVFNVEDSPVQFILKPFGSSLSQQEYMENVLSGFDFGICRIAYDVKGETYYTEDFIIDDNNETITLCAATPNTFVNSMTNHLPRIMAKYPERKVDLPIVNRPARLVSEKDVA